MKYTKWGIAFGFIMVTLGVILTLKFGYKPAPQRIMGPSFFSQAEDVGAIAIKRFYAPLAEEDVVILGLPSNRDWAAAFLKGFIEAAKANQREFKMAVIERQMPESVRSELHGLFPAAREIDSNTETMTELGDAVAEAQTKKEKLLVIVPNVYSSHLLQDAPLRRLEKAKDLQRPLFALTSGPLALEPAQEKELDPVCLGSERDGSGTAPLGCAIMQAGRGYYRKQVLDKEPDARKRFSAIMQAPGANDYLLLIREPQLTQ